MIQKKFRKALFDFIFNIVIKNFGIYISLIFLLKGFYNSSFFGVY